MENNFDNTDLLNSNLLQNEFSNATGCGLPPVCTEKKIVKGSRRSCKTVLGKQVCVNIPTVKTVVNQSCIDSKKRHRDCVNDPNRKKLLEKVKETVKKTTTSVKTATKKAGTNVKKVVVKLKDKAGVAGKSFRNKFRSVMRKGILFNLKNNIHGTASRLYPAVATDGEVASRKYKKSYVGKSRGLYNQVANKWKSLGGNENDLKDAIRGGQSKRFLKAPYKSANGDDSMALYTYYTPSSLGYYWENPNTTFYWGADGELSSADAMYDESMSVEEVPFQEEEVRGIRAFFAWLRGLFGKNQATDNPYAEGTAEYDAFEAERNGDLGNEPDPSEANDADILNLENKGTEDGAGTGDDENAGDDDITEDDTILGMPKVAFWIGVSAVVLIGGYFGYKKFIAKK